MLTITPLDIPGSPPAPAALEPRPLRRIDATRCMLRMTLRHELVYFTLVEYIGHEERIPIGVIVTSPGQRFAQARFHLDTLPLLPRSWRWKQVHAYTANMTRNPPPTRERLEDEVECHTHLRSVRNRSVREAPVLHFRPIQAMLCDPEALLERLFEEDIMGQKTIELDEDLAEAIVEEELAQEFSSKSSNGAKAPSICQFIGSMVRYMKPTEAETALALLAEQEDTTSYDVAVQIVKHVMRQINSKPISPEQLERIFAAWERVPRW